MRDEDLAHTLRLIEIIGRTDIPVVPVQITAASRLVRRRRRGFGVPLPAQSMTSA
jgi:hypothetical protein